MTRKEYHDLAVARPEFELPLWTAISEPFRNWAIDPMPVEELIAMRTVELLTGVQFAKSPYREKVYVEADAKP